MVLYSVPPSRSRVPIGRALREGSARVLDENLLEKIRVPALVLWGKEDWLLPPREGLRLSSDLAGARLLVLPGIGHFPQEEGPEDFSRAVSRFPDEAPGR